jgi:predicted amidophosphoribosyltransferase
VATVSEVTARYENFLVPVLTDRDGVCAVCKRAILPGWNYCYQCNTHRNSLSNTADIVVPIALAVKHDQWAYELFSYKNSSSSAARDSLALRLGAVLWRWLERHERCVEGYGGATEFPLVTAVPSTRGRVDHPLPHILTKIVKPTSDRYAELLTPNPDYPPGSREARDDRYLVTRRMRGEPVMLIDDQWTSGGHAQSAAAALKLAGAGPVAVVALGRHFDRRPDGEDYRDAAESYYRAARSQGWSWTVCCMCGPPGSMG